MHIFGKSSHPVFIKKINLGIWTLRSEIEALIMAKVKELNLNDPSELTDEHIADIKKFYQADQEHDANNVLPFVKNEEKDLKPGTEINDNVDEMMAAMGGDKPEGNPEEVKAEIPAPIEDAPKAPEEAAEILMASSTGLDENSQEIKETMKEVIEENKAPNPVLNKLSKETSPFRKKPDMLEKENISPGVTMLADINMDEILFFSKLPFEYGQSIVMEYLVPKYFVLGAEVIFCNRYNLKSRIINPTRPEYRVRAKFNFQTTGERTLLREFLKSIEPDLPKAKSKKKVDKQEAAESVDDLSELGL